MFKLNSQRIAVTCTWCDGAGTICKNKQPLCVGIAGDCQERCLCCSGAGEIPYEIAADFKVPHAIRVAMSDIGEPGK